MLFFGRRESFGLAWTSGVQINVLPVPPPPPALLIYSAHSHDQCHPQGGRAPAGLEQHLSSLGARL